MVAPTGRVPALFLTITMLFSTLVVLTPAASAQTLPTALFTMPDGSSIAPGTLATNTQLRIFIDATVGPCGLGGGSVTGVTATLESGNALTAADEVITLASNGTLWSGSKVITIGRNLVPGRSGTAETFPVKIAATGCTASNPADFTLPTSPGINVDTIAPTFPTPTIGSGIGLGHDHTKRSYDGVTWAGTASTASIGTTVYINATTTGASTLTWNLDDLLDPNPGTQTIPLAGSSFVVSAGGANNWESINTPGTPRSIPMRATDAAGNFQDRSVSLAVDNVLDPGMVITSISSTTLTRTSSGATATLAATGASGVQSVRVIATDAAGSRVVGNIPLTGGTTRDLGLANPLSTPVNLTLYPVDVSGNFDPAPSATPSPPLPDGITIEYAGTPIPPPSVGGSGMKSVYVNVTTRGPLLPYPTLNPIDQSDLRIYGEWRRDFASTATSAPNLPTTPDWLYWRDGTGGSVLTSDDQNGHFQSTPNRDPGDTTTSGSDFSRRTIFRPTHTASGQGAYVLTNLSGKTFTDGLWQLIIAVDSGENKNFRTIVSRDIHVDSAAPRYVNHPTYSGSAGPGLGPGANTTQTTEIHGMDGNPLRVLIHTTDWENATANSQNKGRKDSGFRNASVELIHADTEQVVLRTSNGAPARVSVTPTSCPPAGTPLATRLSNYALPYCVNVPLSGGGSCPQLPTGIADIHNSSTCVWEEIVVKGRWNTTFTTQRQFSGWVNVTWPDLPAGKFKIRVSIWDNANLEKSQVYGGPISGTDNYKVAPAVSIVSNTTSPRVTTDGKLLVTPLASQRYHQRPSDSRPCSSIDTDVCAADRIMIEVSNKNDGTGAIEQYGGFLTNISAQAERDPTSPLQVTGLTLMNPWNGSLSHVGTFPVRLFPYAQGPLETLPVLPSTIDRTQPIYVRVAAIAVNAAGEEVVRSTSAWAAVVTESSEALQITEPPAEWALNLTSQFGTGATQPRGPRFNVTFAKSAQAGTSPVLDWELTELNRTTVNGSATNLASTLLTTPTQHFYWQGNFSYTGNQPIPPGAYQVKVSVKATSTSTVPLAVAFRNFSVLADAPTVWINASNLSVGSAKRGDTFYVLPSFEVPFKVNHSFANITSADQIELRLLRTTFQTGQSPTLKKGDEGFDYRVFADPFLSSDFLSSNFTANVTMPPGAATGVGFELQIIAHFDVQPFRFPGGNATTSLPIRIDRQPPTGFLRVPESESTVFQVGSNPPINKGTPTPAFRGVAQDDAGSGVTRVDVRIHDLTLNRTIRIENTPRGFSFTQGISETEADWITSASGLVKGYDPAATATQGVVAFGDPAATKEWIIPLWDIEDTDNPGGSPGIINLSHTYRVDVRARDALGSWSTENRTTFDFDAAPPTLGYSGRLNTTNNMKSGIVGPSQISWHGSATLRVNVTDNHCVKAVRLKGLSDLRPNSTPVVAQMTRAGVATPICYEQMTSNTAADGASGTKFSIYQVDLAAYPNFTDDVTTYTYWFEAEDLAGQVSEVPSAFRSFRMEVLDNDPARVLTVLSDPSPAQAGGRAILRADIQENQRVDRVTVRVVKSSSGALVASGNMTPSSSVNNVTRAGIWTVDTQDGLNLTLETGDYEVNITAFDVNWNRTNSPTCPIFCLGTKGILRVRDDGAPSVSLESPTENATVNATPTIKVRALGRTVQPTSVTVTAGAEGAEVAIPAANLTFTELKSPNGTRQGYTIAWAPPALADNSSLRVNVSVNVGGLIATGSYGFRVDASPPTVNATVTGNLTLDDKNWITATTRVALAAHDNVSATTIHYKVNDGAQQTYTGEITPEGPDGAWKLEYWAVDAAGNSAPRSTLSLVMDKTPPRIAVAQHGDELLLTVTDEGVGLNESTVKVHYRYGEAVSFTTANAEKVVGNSFKAVLPGNATATGLGYYFTAEDRLGRAGSNYSAAAPYTIAKGGSGEGNVTPPPPANLPPTIRITQPTTGASVRNSVELKWLAQDPEEAALTISIALRDPPPGRVLLPSGPNSGSYTLNVSGFAAGAYTIVVTANDGENSATSQVTFNVETGRAIAIVNVPPPTVQPNTAVAVGVSISPAGKTVVEARYRVLKDGDLVSQGRLTPSQGVYAATLSPKDAGAYRVFVDVSYTDGTTEPSQQVASFSVPGGKSEDAERVFPASLMTLVAVAVLTIALAAYGAFGRWKK